MYDRELALEILTQTYDSTQTILKRFKPVESVEITLCICVKR